MDILIELFKQYGLMAIVILLVIALTFLIKKKFLEKAIAKVEAEGYDKTVVTKNIMYIPYVLAFIIYFIYYLITIKFNFDLFNFKDIIDNTLVIALASIAVYEQIKLKLEAKKIKKEIEQTNTNNDEIGK